MKAVAVTLLTLVMVLLAFAWTAAVVYFASWLLAVAFGVGQLTWLQSFAVAFALTALMSLVRR